LPMVKQVYTAASTASTHEVTETSTHRPWKASVMPVKLPTTGIT